MKTNHITSYTVEYRDGKTYITGYLPASAGNFEIECEGGGGNSDTYRITLSGGQYDLDSGKPLTFTITGAWEIREVMDVFKLLGNIIGDID